MSDLDKIFNQGYDPDMHAMSVEYHKAECKRSAIVSGVACFAGLIFAVSIASIAAGSIAGTTPSPSLPFHTMGHTIALLISGMSAFVALIVGVEAYNDYKFYKR